jgi:hypothetical protein
MVCIKSIYSLMCMGYYDNKHLLLPIAVSDIASLYNLICIIFLQVQEVHVFLLSEDLRAYIYFKRNQWAPMIHQPSISQLDSNWLMNSCSHQESWMLVCIRKRVFKQKPYIKNGIISKLFKLYTRAEHSDKDGWKHESTVYILLVVHDIVIIVLSIIVLTNLYKT